MLWRAAPVAKAQKKTHFEQVPIKVVPVEGVPVKDVPSKVTKKVQR